MTLWTLSAFVMFISSNYWFFFFSWLMQSVFSFHYNHHIAIINCVSLKWTAMQWDVIWYDGEGMMRSVSLLIPVGYCWPILCMWSLDYELSLHVIINTQISFNDDIHCMAQGINEREFVKVLLKIKLFYPKIQIKLCSPLTKTGLLQSTEVTDGYNRCPCYWC